MYLDDFRDLTERILGALTDKELLTEYNTFKDIENVDNWEKSILQEVIDISWECVRDECMKRFICDVKNRDSSNCLVVAYSRDM